MKPQRSTAAWVNEVYTELRAIAHRNLASERPSHTLQTTALVHEAYVRLCGASSWPGRAEFMAAAAHVMREILIDYARSRSRVKRGGDLLRITLNEVWVAIDVREDTDVLAVDAALKKLERLDERQARIVEMRFFAGMSIEEVAEILEVAPKTVSRDWTMARAWLRRELARASS